MLSQTEENYLKSLLHLSVEKDGEVGTNELAAYLGVKPASVNDMLKKLKEKELVNYEKYGKISLTDEGRKKAIDVVRKHRLWETFLYEKFDFTWDEVHEVAEQLEHIQSAKLVDKLDEFLNFPAYDPHGDVIPNAKGEMPVVHKKTLQEEEVGHHCTMVAVKDNSAPFLQYVNKMGLSINNKIKVLARHSYDQLIEIEVNGKVCSISPRFAQNIVIVCDDCSKKKVRVKKA
ncbi:MAG TPA: metal-dependent transcriptional regulator [Puia sp.]|jgi:DtxR family Mn-dependent transcriptional regulator|nr:metal-dependent transcriptional regulator [Puia sp.]